MKYTKKQIKKGFANWETDYRLNPSSFNSTKETANQDIKDYSENQLNNLIKYIKQ